jgi:hypothetical protein
MVETLTSPDSAGMVVHGPVMAGADWITAHRVLPRMMTSLPSNTGGSNW